MKKAIFFSTLFTLFLFFSKTSSAQACSAVGESCCVGTFGLGAHYCTNGFSCDSPSDKCVTNASTGMCGTEGNSCCPGDYWMGCNSNLACDIPGGKICRACGVAGAPCCINYACGPNLLCVQTVTTATDKQNFCFARDASCTSIDPIQRNCPAASPEQCYDGAGNKVNLCCGTGKCPALPNTREGGDSRCDAGDGTGAGTGIRTAIGCFTTKGSKGISTLLSWGTGIAGGIAFIMILYAAFQITTAQGDPKRVKAGQELITAALAGLFLVAFAVVVLNIIGVNVLGLQGFGFKG